MNATANRPDSAPGAEIAAIHHLSKTYGEGESEVRALIDVDMGILRGEFIAIMGPSGSGKSTLMHLLGCLDRPTSGEYYLDGRKVSSLSRDELARVRGRKIGFVFQDFNLLPRTSALENVELPMLYTGSPREERKKKAASLLRLVDLAERASHRPSELSGGQKQRVAIARALANDAPFLLADEPTGNLDSRSSREIMELFSSLNREREITVVVVTHDREVARWARRIVMLGDGRVVGIEQGGGR